MFQDITEKHDGQSGVGGRGRGRGKGRGAGQGRAGQGRVGAVEGKHSADIRVLELRGRAHAILITRMTRRDRYRREPLPEYYPEYYHTR